MISKRVAVIGAGLTGLMSIKCLKEENIEPVCFEKTSHYGGLWRYHEEDIEGISSVMKTTITNVSKEMLAMSDFPPPEDTPNYMHWAEFYEIFTLFAEKFDLLRHIQFNHEVCKVELNEDYNETGRLKLTLRDTKTNQVSEEVFDGVTICVGHHVHPNMPTFPGQEKFKGTIKHTRSVRTCHNFVDQVVVVVGVGSSGVDCAVEISSVSKQVYLSTRRGTWVIPRLAPSGLPFDIAFMSRFNNLILQYAPFNFPNYLLELFLNLHFDHSKFNIKPKHRVFSHHPPVSDGLPVKLLCGDVKVKPNIKEFLEDGVIFEGEDTVTRVDTVVFATGYLMKFPFVDENICTVENNIVHLYKYIYPPQLHYKTLGFLGLIQPLGGGVPVVEAQARLFCQVFNGKVQLPNGKEMEKVIEKERQRIESRYVNSLRHTVEVDLLTYLDDINSTFGAKPNLLKMLFVDQKLFFALLFGPSLPYQYRLQGPHSWSEARNTILSYKKRVYIPLKKDYKPEESGLKNIFLRIFFVICLFVISKNILVFIFNI